MESQINEDLRAGREHTEAAAKAYGSGLRHAKKSATTEVKNLLADVEDLLRHVSNVSDADIAKVRGRVEESLATAKTKLADVAQQTREGVRGALESTDESVRGSPWMAVGVAAAVGVILGVALARR